MSKSSLVFITAIAALLIAGCQCVAQLKPLDDVLSDPMLEERINDYLVENVSIIGFGGEAYCAYEYLNADQGGDGEIYIWVLCQEFYLDQGSVVEGSGISLPVALQTEEKNDQLEVIGHLVPRDGTYYGPDVRTIFPISTWPQIMPQNEEETDQYNYRADKLMEETRLKARLDYQLKIEDQGSG